MNKIIVGMGEALWDCLPEGKKIGGAPANFAYHASQFGFDSRVVSAVGADADGLAHVPKEGFAAVRIGIAGCIVGVGADVDIHVVVLKKGSCQGCRRGQHEAVPEGHVGGHLSFSVFRNLLGITLVHDFFRGIFQKRAVGILENLGQVEFIMFQMVVLRHLPGRQDFLLMLLPIKNRSSHNIVCSQSVNSQGNAGGRIHASAG